ncbi:isoamyl alcohol oxidase [Plectosphaerella plurivora]|uniref:Isoamyl alcohol oxidase n=1 Tax=Plectosphaerella plurivora TaxID=936078 RepID=A0A9P8VJT5_9PEZI|nr:isoamyl alcohol oxidase [Plectosphaerella plurivora]
MLAILKLAAGVAVLATQTVSAGPVRSPGALIPRSIDGQEYACKCYPGEDCWPAQTAWDALDAEVDGNLQLHVPPEAACYNTFDGLLGSIETYDKEKCDDVTAKWADAKWNVDTPALNLWKYWTNVTCTPTEDPTESCTLGYYGVYVIMAKTHDHIKAGINFARDNNLRLVIRNTGHDFVGRSTGYGSLIINTHSFQDINFHTWTGPGKYRGGAVTIAAGVQGGTVLAAAAARNPPVTLVTGECATVGVAGGYIGGGGHGPLTSKFGMAADNALQFEVITARGELVKANAGENADLFFALRGGGPSTYGVVVSATFRTYEEVISSGGTLFINSTHTFDENLIWEGIRIFHSYGNHFVANEMYTYFEIFPFTFRAVPLVAVGKTVEELDEILRPMVEDLNAAGVPFELTTKGFKSNYELYVDLFEEELAGLHALSGGWGFVQEDVERNNDGIVEAFRKVQNPRADLPYSGAIIGHFFRPPPESADMGSAALNPRWRNSTNFAISTFLVPEDATLEQKKDYQHVLTDIMDDALKKAGPNGYAYINEADPFLPNWSEHFWGPSVYPKLKCIRDKWDPEMVFFAMATVGTEKWEVIEDNTRLCLRLD